MLLKANDIKRGMTVNPRANPLRGEWSKGLVLEVADKYDLVEIYAIIHNRDCIFFEFPENLTLAKQ